MYFPTVFLTFFVMSVIWKVSAERYEVDRVFFPSKEPITSVLTRRLKRNVNNYEIPVTVLHDDVIQKPIKARKNLINKKDISEQLKQTIFAEKSTVRPQSIKTFPKRPEADNKRIEFRRQSRLHPPFVQVLDSQNFVYAHNGNFHYSYDLQDGTKISSEGKLLRNDKNEANGEAVIGSVSYKDDEGNDYSFSYTADENGYRPVGAHLPTPPPIPPEIARALEHLATKKPDLATDY